MTTLNPFMLCLPSPVAGEYSRAIADRWGLGYYPVHRIVNKNSYVWHTDAIDLELELLKQQQEAENDAQQQGL